MYIEWYTDNTIALREDNGQIVEYAEYITENGRLDLISTWTHEYDLGLPIETYISTLYYRKSAGGA